MTLPQNHKKKKAPLKDFAKYSTLAFQMLAIILGGVFLGIKLDSWLSMAFPIFTIVLSIVSIGLAVYYSIKDFI